MGKHVAADNSTADEVRRLERTFWQAVADRDVDGATRLLAEDAVSLSGHGIHRFDPAGYAAILRDDRMRLLDFALGDIDVLQPTADLAIATYTAWQAFERDGERIEMRAHGSSTWLRRDGRWTCVAHSESATT